MKAKQIDITVHWEPHTKVSEVTTMLRESEELVPEGFKIDNYDLSSPTSFTFVCIPK
jgi:hypothetical protein